MANKVFFERTIEFLFSLKNDPDIDESDFEDILAVLGDRILKQDADEIRANLENIGQSKQKCASCGELLGAWEKGICGPCKITDPKFKEELDE